MAAHLQSVFAVHQPSVPCLVASAARQVIPAFQSQTWPPQVVSGQSMSFMQDPASAAHAWLPAAKINAPARSAHVRRSVSDFMTILQWICVPADLTIFLGRRRQLFVPNVLFRRWAGSM